MKKVFFTSVVVLSVLVSCGPSKEDYKQSALEMCDCMKEKNVENEELKALNIDMTDANYRVKFFSNFLSLLNWSAPQLILD